MRDRKLFLRYSVPAHPTADNKGIRFCLPDGTIQEIYKHVDVVWHVLRLADGSRAVTELIEETTQAMPAAQKPIVVSAIRELIAMGVLTQAGSSYATFHPFTNNPPVFSKPLTKKEVIEHTESPRLPVKTGQTFAIEQKPTASFSALQAKRRSYRQFSKKAVPLDTLGHILVSAYSLPLRSNPSAGGLYPLKLYVIIPRVQGKLQAGYYEYDPEVHQLSLYDVIDREVIGHALNDETLLGNAAAILLIGADLPRTTFKYGDRGYRFVLLEAGHAAQNLHLAAAEQNLGVLEYGGFTDDILSQELGLKDQHVTPLIVVGLGHPLSAKPVPSLYERLQSELVGEDKPVQSVRLVQRQESHKDPTLGMYSARANGTFLGSNRPLDAGGTAPSEEVARVKALAEAYERYAAGLVRVDYTASAQELSKQGKDWLDPQAIAPLHPTQYAKDDNLAPFNKQQQWQWISGTELANKSTVLLPIDLVFYPLHIKHWNRKQCAWANSSGVAAHTSQSEATKRGLLELLERHALMSTWLTHSTPKRVPTKFLPFHWQRRVDYWKEQGRDVHVLDLSTHGEVTIKVVIVSDKYPCYINGAASSVDSFEAAVAKAFQEAEMAIRPMEKHPRTGLLKPEEVTDVADHADYYALAHNARKLAWLWKGEFLDNPPQSRISIRELYKKLDAIAVHLSPKNAPLSVVRVLSSQLVPISFGFGQLHYTHPATPAVHPTALREPHDFS